MCIRDSARRGRQAFGYDATGILAIAMAPKRLGETDQRQEDQGQDKAHPRKMPVVNGAFAYLSAAF